MFVKIIVPAVILAVIITFFSNTMNREFDVVWYVAGMSAGFFIVIWQRIYDEAKK